jgi:hypothetical protein
MSKRYGPVRVIDSLDLTVGEGEVYGFPETAPASRRPSTSYSTSCD